MKNTALEGIIFIKEKCLSYFRRKEKGKKERKRKNEKGLYISLILVLIVGLVAVMGCSSKTPPTGAKVLKVGSDIEYAPFEYFDENNQPVGFDIDLMTAIAEDLGYEVVFESAAFDGLIPSLQQGKYDAVISAMTITEERAKSVAFSDPYFKAVQYIVFKKGGTYEKIADLAGKKIGVQLNTTGQFAAEDAGFEPHKFSTTPDALSALIIGGVDAVIADNQPVLNFIEANQATDIVSIEADTEDEFYGIAFKLDNPLVEEFNAVLKKFKEDGTYKEIYSKWFAGDVPKF